MTTQERAIRSTKLILIVLVLWLGVLAAGQALAGGLIAYDSGIQGTSNVSPLLPVGSAWRFGVGAQHQASKTFSWGVAAEYLYSGTLDTNLQSNAPVALGGRGDLVGSYDNIYTLFFGIYGNWKF